ncbi:MAG: DinB family protein [Gemmatimonadetes bacterium]|nr:DinB family protein [Gemmatimonadota bacterium]MDA1103451.1 DinB family protein [Gemmatimonadota bacterium]
MNVRRTLSSLSRRSTVPSRFRPPVVVLIVAAVVSGCGASSDLPTDAPPLELRLADLQRTVETARDKFTALAAAMPADDLAWRPMEGVRSVSEVYIHIAADNFFVPALMGWEAPAATGITSDVTTFRTYQQRTMSRDEMLAALDASFEFFLTSMEQSAGDLDREVVLGTPTTVADVWIRAVTHLHEHLGQSIAYARSNEVVPPWSG